MPDSIDISLAERPTQVGNGDNRIFPFELELDVASPLVTFDDSAQLYGRIRHFNDQPIELLRQVAGGLSIGIRMYRKAEHGERDKIFEDRMVVDDRYLEPDKWTSASVKIPRSIVNFHDTFIIRADMVKEEEYWFASYADSETVLEVKFADGLSLKNVPHNDNSSTLSSKYFMQAGHARSGAGMPSISTNAKVHLVFDVSDLIQYFHNARLPTGIQRVQIEVITNLIFSLPQDCSLKIACFTKESDSWLEIPALFFNHVCKLCVINGDPNAADWKRVLEELRLQIEQAAKLQFERGSYLINLGTSWWLQNYFLHVRAAKARFGIRYVPYVHDCIPIMTPEHCVDNLTRDFITWALGAFQHADHIMVNSKATAADVKLVAAQLGHDLEYPSVVTLDADYRAANAGLPCTQLSVTNSDIFLRHDIRPNEYVLFVSTIESRKNHLMAFSAWLSMAKKHGLHRVPKLVCVGNRGWLNDAIYAKLAASKVLHEKVALLSRISDPDLELLYRNCLFTLYPSAYEGWGLPVTESLCFGKVPVLANGSSLPEAGGDFGEYFDLGSETELLRLLERMIFDEAYRAQREHHIVENFRPRSWTAIADNIVSLVREWAGNDPPADAGRETFTSRGLWPFPIELGRYYALAENEHTSISRGMIAGEMFRQGDGWWWTEPWGCWTKAKVARLAFLAPLNARAGAVAFVGIRGVQGFPATATVRLEGIDTRRVNLGPGQSQWLVFRISQNALRAQAQSENGTLFEFLFSCDACADFRESTEGRDHRVASIGVCGFMVCADDDIALRLRFVESVALGDLHSMSLSPGIGT